MTEFEDIEREREAQVFAEGHPGFAGPGEEEFDGWERRAHVHVEARTEREAEERIADVMRVVDEALARARIGGALEGTGAYIELDESPAEEI